MPDPLRVGLAGFGLAGRVFHAPLVATTPGLRLDAIVTRDAGRRAQAAAAYPDAVLVDDVPAALARGLDLLVVASRNDTHAELATAAVRAGVPVVVDKPFARTAEEARTVLAEATAAGVPVTVFQNRRWDGDFRTVRRLVEDGSLGTVRRFESRFERWRPARGTGWRESGDRQLAGGLLVDLGAHLVDQALVLLGPVDTVYAELDRRRPGAEVDDDTFVALHHTGGARSHLWASSVADDLGPRFRVLGDRAAYTVHGLDGQEAALTAGGHPTDPGWGMAPEHAWGRLGVPGDTRPVPTLRGSYDTFYRQVEQALRTGGPMPVDPASAVDALVVLAAARRSAVEGSVVAL